MPNFFSNSNEVQLLHTPNRIPRHDSRPVSSADHEYAKISMASLSSYIFYMERDPRRQNVGAGHDVKMSQQITSTLFLLGDACKLRQETTGHMAMVFLFKIKVLSCIK